MFRAAAILLLIAALLRAEPASAVPTSSLGSGAWSWFADPRAVWLDGKAFVGWIDRRGEVQVASYNVRTGRREVATIKRGLGRDDHNDPALLVRRDGRLTAFFSPHSGYILPPPGIPSRLYSRTTLRPGGVASWGPLRTVGTNTPGRLGYTYPNPVELRREHRVWLFWRGGNWQPSFSTSRNAVDWRRARTMIRGPGRNRPYVKYASNGRDTIDIAFTAGNPSNLRTGIRYARYRHGAFRTAGGRLIRRIRELPFRPSQADTVYRPERRRGRAWVFDVASDRGGVPVIVYVTYPTRGRLLYRYARWDGRRWRNNDIVRAGPPIAGHYAAGISLDHEDASVVYLSRKVGGAYEVERWTTPDAGVHWSHIPITSGSRVDNLRPISPRGLSGRDLVVWLRGRYDGYRNYVTTVTTLRSFPRPATVELSDVPVG